ncbi:MAG: hypothetical protein K5761_06340 [Clostridiales bacterium]|nr:hypothetical protein [Clostridiales bacterium]
MAANAREARILPADMQFLLSMLRGIAASGLKYVYRGEFPVPGGVQVRLGHSISFSSWGEDITITMTAQGNQTFVDIFSECSLPTQIIDYGKNRKNVNVIFNFLMQNIYAHNQPRPNANVCPNCGKPFDNVGSFCSVCGTKIR